MNSILRVFSLLLFLFLSMNPYLPSAFGMAEKNLKLKEVPVKTIYRINDKNVSQKEFEEFQKQLNGQEAWYCKETKNGGITGWISKNANGEKFQLKFDQSKEPNESVIESLNNFWLK